MITDSPTQETLPLYLELYREYNVTTVVRLCTPLYDPLLLNQNEIAHVELPFDDGTVPELSIFEDWRSLVLQHKNKVISVHCFSGLGRAPLMVGDSLIRAGMDKIDAIELLRSKRNGALNSRQFQYLMNIHPPSWFPCLYGYGSF